MDFTIQSLGRVASLKGGDRVVAMASYRGDGFLVVTEQGEVFFIKLPGYY